MSLAFMCASGEIQVQLQVQLLVYDVKTDWEAFQAEFELITRRME